MKAMILAAGKGERLKPFTTITPKPLLPVGDTTLLAHVLAQIKAAGITEVIINVHHLYQQIVDYCGTGEKFGLSLQYSIEDILLETGGGIFRVLPLFENKPFLVMSADIWTDYPLQTLLSKQVSHGHLVFVDNPDFHQQGDYGLDHQGTVRDDLSSKLTYANMAVLHPRLFEGQKDGIFRLNNVLKPAIQQGVITGERYAGDWHNVGTEKEWRALS